MTTSTKLHSKQKLTNSARFSLVFDGCFGVLFGSLNVRRTAHDVFLYVVDHLSLTSSTLVNSRTVKVIRWHAHTKLRRLLVTSLH